jgi:hypothetical protein
MKLTKLSPHRFQSEVPAHARAGPFLTRAPLRSLSPVFGGRSRARGPESGAIGSARLTSVWVGKRALRARVTVEGPDQLCCLLSLRGGSSIRCRNVVDGASRSFCRGQASSRVTVGPTCLRAPGSPGPMLRSVRRGRSRISGRGVDEGRGWVGIVKYRVGAAEQGDEADEAFAGTVASRRCRLMPAPDHF